MPCAFLSLSSRLCPNALFPVLGIYIFLFPSFSYMITIRKQPGPYDSIVHGGPFDPPCPGQTRPAGESISGRISEERREDNILVVGCCIFLLGVNNAAAPACSRPTDSSTCSFFSPSQAKSTNRSAKAIHHTQPSLTRSFLIPS